MLNVPAKLEVFFFIRYGDMTGVKNAHNRGVLEWLGVTQGHRQYHHSIDRIRYPIRL